MKLKTLAVAALLATTGSAFASGGDLGWIDDTLTPVSSTVSGGFFQDFYTFSLASTNVVYGGLLSSGVNQLTVTLISGGSTLASDTSPLSFDFGSLGAGSYTLSVLGFPTGAGIKGYGGFVVAEKLVAAPVPEPQTYALMLAGLGVVGFVAGRRRRSV